MKDDCPTPYPSIYAAFREIVPAVGRQIKDPGYYIKRKLPEPKARPHERCPHVSEAQPGRGRLDRNVCAVADLKRDDILRFDHGQKTLRHLPRQ